MTMNVTPTLELTLDPLSVASPTWIDVTDYLLYADTKIGNETDGDRPQAGTANFVLDNRDRRWEPEFQGVLTNRIKNPNFEVNLNRWSTAGSGTTTRTRDTTEHFLGVASQKIVTDGTFASQGANYDDSLAGVVVVPGEVWTLSGYFKQAAGGLNAQVAIEWRDSGGATLSTNSANLVLGAGVWTRHSVTATAPASAAKAFCRFRTASAVAVTFFIDACQMELAAKMSDYIDGAQDNGRWDGTANDSVSYRGGPYYPNIRPMRRFRFKIQDGVGAGTVYDHGIWYVQDWNPDIIEGGLNEEANVQCVDGFAVLAQQDLPALSPPDADSYEDVVAYDDPSFYYRLGEPDGTRVVHQVRKIRKKDKSKKGYHLIKKRSAKVRTKYSAEGVSGPTGVYKNLPDLGQPGLILGDPGTSVRMHSADNQYVLIGPLDKDEMVNTNRFSVEAWAKPASSAASGKFIIQGPKSSGGYNVFEFYANWAASAWTFFVQGSPSSIQANSTTAPQVGVLHHIVGTWDGSNVLMYVNGVLEGSASGVGPILKADDNEFMRFFSDQFTGNDFDGNGQELAIYEQVLTPERVMAHYVAGSQRGWPRQSTGSRVLDVVTSPLWVETGIQGGLFPVPPDMQVGQSRASVIEDMVAIEGPNAMFFFGDDGAPRFLDYDNRDVVGSSRNSPQATFGNGTSEQPFVDVDLAYDNLIYNQVTVMGVSGVEQYAEDADSIVEFGERPMPPLDLPVDGDAYALTMAQTLVAVYAWPQYIVKSIDLDGTGPSSVRSQMLLRDLGDCIRVKVRPTGGSQVPIDHVGWIIGIHRTLERETGRLTATFYLSRGFDSGDGLWHAGVGGFSEADLTTVAA